MSSGTEGPVWKVLGRSVRGAAHVRNDLPNQDAIGWFPETGTGPPLLLAVSDGHGGARYFRSDVGARLAVQTVVTVVDEFLRNSQGVENLSIAKRWAEERLPHEIVRHWKEAVADHLTANPIEASEWERLEMAESASRRRQVALDPVIAYGATLLSVLVTEFYILHIQLGDGDIVTVDDSEEATRPPVPRDERLIGNETTSLCTREAWRDFRLFFQVLSGSLPAMVLVSTDGFSNSFRDEAAFLSVGADLLHGIRSEGLEAWRQATEGWLMEVSEEGSGDDISLGILCRIDALELPAGRIPSEPAFIPEVEPYDEELWSELDALVPLDDEDLMITESEAEADALARPDDEDLITESEADADAPARPDDGDLMITESGAEADAPARPDDEDLTITESEAEADAPLPLDDEESMLTGSESDASAEDLF